MPVAMYAPIEPVMIAAPSKSVLLCDVPFLEGIEADLPFRSHNADVPDDLMACAPIHGWDSPPDSPAHISVEMLDGVDPMLNDKISNIFDDSANPYDWAPPGSPDPSTGCDDLLRDFPDLNAFGMIPVDDDELSPSASPEPEDFDDDDMEPFSNCSNKRKASSLSLDDREKKRIRDKQEQVRTARTEACEEAVKALVNSKNDEDPESKRHTHNVLERKRRNDLKNSYQLLREQVPSLEDDDRAPTGKILLHAVEFIAHLKKTECLLDAAIIQARQENERLRRK